MATPDWAEKLMLRIDEEVANASPLADQIENIGLRWDVLNTLLEDDERRLICVALRYLAKAHEDANGGKQ